MTAHDPGGKVRLALSCHIRSEAEFSPCGRYRWSLRRTWDNALPAVMFLMMNPSVADVQMDDPTVAKCGRFAVRWGYGSLHIGNVCAYRATDKRRLLEVDDPVGAGNLPALLSMSSLSDMTVVAHGQLPRGLQVHALSACAALRRAGVGLHMLRLSKDGTPWHPLYLPEILLPQPWT